MVIPNGGCVSWHLLARIEPVRVPAAHDEAVQGALLAVGLFSEAQPTARLSGQWMEIEKGEGRPGVSHDSLWAVNAIALNLAGRRAGNLWLNWLRNDARERAKYHSSPVDTTAFLIDRWAYYHQNYFRAKTPIGDPWLRLHDPCTQCKAPRAAPTASYAGSKLCIPCAGCRSTKDVDGSSWTRDMMDIRAADLRRLARR